MTRILIFVLILLGSATVSADEKQDLADLEKTYRQLLTAVHQKDYDSILSLVHKDGLGGADATTSRDQISKDLRNPGSYLRKALYAPIDDVAADLCEEQGRSPLSPAAFYSKFKDTYKVTTQVLKAGTFWSVGATARSDSNGERCQYFLHALTFMKEKDGKFYLVSNFR